MAKVDWMWDALRKMEIDAIERGWPEMIDQINATRRILSAEAKTCIQPDNLIRVDFRSPRATGYPGVSVFP